MLALAAAALAGCSDDEPVPALSLHPSSLVFTSAESAPQQVTVDTDAGEWGASADRSWIYLSQQNFTLLVSVARNDSPQERKGTVTVVAGTAQTTLAVTQQGAP